ncbi:MAG: LTXXQ domain protein [Pseudomonas sp.]|nr:MAG: LTXXQ domain protein [Pseudomonas sp.]
MRKTLTALLLAASLPTIALAMPEDAPYSKPVHGEHHSQAGHRGHHGERGGRMFQELDLSREQRQQLNTLMREQRAAPQRITQKYLDKLPQADREAMHKELESARLEHDKAVRDILTAEQQKILDARKAAMEQRRAERAEFEAWKAEKDKQTR